ncbi:MAG: hypothetical protein JWN03_2021 [Nocardia sp.]|nr:hypothetical protein [Nocardia sp.]
MSATDAHLTKAQVAHRVQLASKTPANWASARRGRDTYGSRVGASAWIRTYSLELRPLYETVDRVPTTRLGLSDRRCPQAWASWD